MWCANKLNRSKYCIGWKARKLGIKVNKDIRSMINSKANRGKGKYKINKEMFQPISPEGAYVLGLLWADGSIREGKGRYAISIENNRKDLEEVLDIFRRVGNWSVGYTKTNKMRLRACDPDFYQIMCEWGYRDKSGCSPQKVLNYIPVILRHYWWRGYLDGDGHVSKANFMLQFTSCMKQDWDFIFHAFPDCGFRTKVNVKNHLGKKGQIIGNSIAILYTHEGYKKVLDYIFTNYEQDKIGFSRKYASYKHRMNLITGKPPRPGYSSRNRN